jgi:hypothetical protein
LDWAQEICEILAINPKADNSSGELEYNYKFIFDKILGFHGKGFVITKDNYIKLFKIVQKVEIGIPLVIQGETGCGKTHLVDFMATCLRGDEFRCFTLHAGVSQEKLVERMKIYCEQARNLTGVNNFGKEKLFIVLFDEFNTSPFQAVIAEIMNDRRCSISSTSLDIPEKMRFVACCNPFRLNFKNSDNNIDDDEIGYIVEKRG